MVLMWHAALAAEAGCGAGKEGVNTHTHLTQVWWLVAGLVAGRPKRHPGCSKFFQLETWMQDESVKLSEESPGIIFTREEEEGEELEEERETSSS